MYTIKKSGIGWLFAIAAIGIAGCSTSGADLSEVERLVRPRLNHFEGFERWARRAVSAEAMGRSPDALRETLFAPMRLDRGSLTLWVERLGPLGRVYMLERGCDAPPGATSFAELRNLDIGWARGQCGSESAIFLRRDRAGQHGDVRVTVAYALSGAQP